MPAIAAGARRSRSFLFLEVEGLDAIRTAAAGTAAAFPERTTFYGSREIGVKDPAGHYFTFAEF